MKIVLKKNNCMVWKWASWGLLTLYERIVEFYNHVLLGLWTIISDIEQFKHISFFQKMKIVT